MVFRACLSEVGTPTRNITIGNEANLDLDDFQERQLERFLEGLATLQEGNLDTGKNFLVSILESESYLGTFPILFLNPYKIRLFPKNRHNSLDVGITQHTIGIRYNYDSQLT